ncbi:hypothetical protein HCN44_005786 [Aphidius gifuensis]|uniref:C2H2-type domain-containing protein n=1 Tax=Aphidius gifuensis TaxID=684658 RepID=A0A835CU61_APHGI|nr:hypothetical protein HCN44_005786 [Aphidius gifuensis]
MSGIKWAAAWQRWSVPSIMWRSGGGLSKNFIGTSPTNPDGFNCPTCGRVYKLKSSLRNHQKWECNREPAFACNYCAYRAKQKMHIARHMERFFARIGWTGETNRRRNYNNINNNINNNNEDIVPEPLTPQRRARLHCPTRHNNRNNNRQLTISTHEKRHDCSRCGKSYKNAYILRRHILYECGKLPSFNCSQCSFSSKYERNLKAHINHRHVMTKQQPNSTLNQRTSFDQQYYNDSQPSISYQQLEQQLPQITSVISRGNYHCQKCGKFYDIRQSLLSHIRRECEVSRKYTYGDNSIDVKPSGGRNKPMWRPFTCQTCGKSYSRRDTLRRHQVYECGKAPKYHCLPCRKGFKQKSNFQRHNVNVHGSHADERNQLSRLHHGRVMNQPKPYPCSKCNRSYRSKDEDDGFLQIKEEPCQCTECLEFNVSTLWNIQEKPIKRRYKRRGGKKKTKKPKSTIVEITCLPKEKKKKRGPYKKRSSGPPEGYQCPICGNLFTYQWVLNNHLNVSHKKSSSFRQPKDELLEPKCEPMSPL